MAKNFKLVLSEGRLKQLAKSLKIGDILFGKVIRRLGPERYLIQFQGQEVVASFSGVLKSSSLIKTMVQSVKPQIVLKCFQGQKLAADVNTLLAHFRKVIPKQKGSILLRPQLSKILNDTREDLASCLETASSKRGFKIFEEEVTSFLSQLFVTNPKEQSTLLPGQLKHIVETRFRMPLPILLSLIKRLDASQVPAEEDPSGFYERVESLQDNLNKLYLNLSLERDIYLSRKNISIIQVPFLINNSFEEIVVLFKKISESQYLMRFLLGEDPVPFDFRLLKQPKKIIIEKSSFFRQPERTDFFLDFIRMSSSEASYFEKEGNPWEDAFDREAITFDLLMPAKLNILV